MAKIFATDRDGTKYEFAGINRASLMEILRQAGLSIEALWSAVRYEVPIGVVVFNNGQYQANRLNQHRYGGRMLETGKYIGVDLGHPDISYVRMAETYGLGGERVEKPSDLAAALKRCQLAMLEGRPYLVDVRIATWPRVATQAGTTSFLLPEEKHARASICCRTATLSASAS